MLTVAVLVFFVFILLNRPLRKKMEPISQPRGKRTLPADPAVIAAFVGLLVTLAPMVASSRNAYSRAKGFGPQPVAGLIAFAVVGLYIVIRKRGR